MNTARLRPIRILVTRRGSARDRAAREGAGLAARRSRSGAGRPSRTQSGHWKPTEALTMHSGQIGRSQRVQRMPVSRSGCR